MPTVPDFPGQSRKLTLHPTVLEAFKIVPENFHNYKSDHDRMLVGQDQCQHRMGASGLDVQNHYYCLKSEQASGSHRVFNLW